MTAESESTRHALREHRERERDLLERVTEEALRLERLPEGEEPRGSTVVDGHLIPAAPRRVRGTLTVRW